MQYLVTGEEMKEYDRNTITYFQMDALVLMERAALGVAAWIEGIPGRKDVVRRQRVLVAAGGGNNGGDGLAAGRILALAGHAVTFVLIGGEAACSRETGRQIEILKKYGFPIQSKIEKGEYDSIIDALLGIGLSRDMTGVYAEATEAVNRMREAGALVLSLDIPSGIHAGTGQMMGCAVKADHTVTFGWAKRGHFLYPGVLYTGGLTVLDIGMSEHSFRDRKPLWFTYNGLQDICMPFRTPEGHKGTFGKVLLIAGQRCMAGACILAGRGVLRSGAGMLKIITHASNRIILQETLPEATLVVYGRENEEEDLSVPSDPETFRSQMQEALEWADGIVIGPGLGVMPGHSKWLLEMVLTGSRLPLVMDADALNLLGLHQELRQLLSTQKERTIILTPHKGEYARLTGTAVGESKVPDFEGMHKIAEDLHCVIVCKDARTCVCEAGREDGYLNTSGNSGMATAGSGDVLAGLIAGILVQKTDAFSAACMGVHLHGMAGDEAAREKSRYGMTAVDIAQAIPIILRKAEEYL